MHTGKGYGLSEFLDWTRRDIYLLIVPGTVPVITYQLGNLFSQRTTSFLEKIPSGGKQSSDLPLYPSERIGKPVEAFA
jgi:hypothetical protein